LHLNLRNEERKKEEEEEEKAKTDRMADFQIACVRFKWEYCKLS